SSARARSPVARSSTPSSRRTCGSSGTAARALPYAAIAAACWPLLARPRPRLSSAAIVLCAAFSASLSLGSSRAGLACAVAVATSMNSTIERLMGADFNSINDDDVGPRGGLEDRGEPEEHEVLRVLLLLRLLPLAHHDRVVLRLLLPDRRGL